MTDGFIAGIGAANVDFHAQSRASLILRDSNPGAARVSAGGVTRNILENLARLGERVTLLTALGDDFQGRYLREQCAALGIDTGEALLCPGQASSCYLALLDSDGDMYAALSDMRILENITPAWLAGKRALLSRAGAIVCDPCLPAETLEYIVSGAFDGVPLFADPVSTTYARRLAPFAGGFSCLKPNRMELAALTDTQISSDRDIERAAEQLLRRGTRRVAVSLGERGCYWADCEGNRFFRALRPVKHMTDATGAGDAFLAGLIYSHRRGYDPVRSADTALAAGIAAVTSAGTVSAGLCPELLKHIMEENR